MQCNVANVAIQAPTAFRTNASRSVCCFRRPYLVHVDRGNAAVSTTNNSHYIVITLCDLKLTTQNQRYTSEQNIDPVVHDENHDRVTTMMEEQ